MLMPGRGRLGGRGLRPGDRWNGEYDGDDDGKRDTTDHSWIEDVISCSGQLAWLEERLEFRPFLN